MRKIFQTMQSLNHILDKYGPIFHFLGDAINRKNHCVALFTMKFQINLSSIQLITSLNYIMGVFLKTFSITFVVVVSNAISG